MKSGKVNHATQDELLHQDGLEKMLYQAFILRLSYPTNRRHYQRCGKIKPTILQESQQFCKKTNNPIRKQKHLQENKNSVRTQKSTFI